MKRKMDSRRGFALLILTGLILFIIFNFSTTHEMLMVFFGDTLAVLFFAVAVSLLDFAGLARLVTPEQDMKKEPEFVRTLFAVWFCSVIVDVAFTWAWAWMSLNAVKTSSGFPDGVHPAMLVILPLAVALMEVGIRVPLVVLVGQYGDQILHGSRRGAAVKSPKQYPAIPKAIFDERHLPKGVKRPSKTRV